MSSTVYFLDPDPSGEDVLTIADLLRQREYKLKSQSEEIFLMSKVGELIREHGTTRCLAFQRIEEAVLPDATPPTILADTLRYCLNRVAPTDELLIIDPYLFPANPAPDYLAFIESILRPSLLSVKVLHAVTLPGCNTSLESQFELMAKTASPKLQYHSKRTNSFHDRFWIADKTRGLFVGTSLNGIGRRYSLIDYLDPRDVAEIYGRFLSLP